MRDTGQPLTHHPYFHLPRFISSAVFLRIKHLEKSSIVIVYAIGKSEEMCKSQECTCTVVTMLMLQGSQDSSGPPRVKSKLEVEESSAMAQYCSPQRSFREKITDFFYSSEEAGEERGGSVSPTMPVLVAEGRGLRTPEPGEDQASERSEGDSGKENDGDSAPVLWRGSRGSLASRGSRPRSGCLADLNPTQANLASPLGTQATPQPIAKEARGRVTRSSLGKIPLSLKSCEQLQNEFNIADGVHGREAAAQGPSSPPTPHKIIRVKEPGLCNPLQKLKQISLTPKKSAGSSTKRSKVNKRWVG